jgi:hypothetical protein
MPRQTLRDNLARFHFVLRTKLVPQPLVSRREQRVAARLNTCAFQAEAIQCENFESPGARSAGMNSTAFSPSAHQRNHFC